MCDSHREPTRRENSFVTITQHAFRKVYQKAGHGRRARMKERRLIAGFKEKETGDVF